ncbi:MAG TPA: phage tail tube protein [Thauera aminoaromatica]|nr:phage tail tube protein [Thauera aminoaromatica]
MSYLALVGSAFAITTGLASAKAISNITNADPPVFTATAHGYSNADEVLLVVDWEDFNYSIIRVSNQATNTFEVAGYDSTNTTFYPQGSDTGNAYKISGWQSLGQILGITPQGGDARYEELAPFDKRNGVRIATGFNPSSFEMELGFDDSRTDQTLLLAASRAQEKLGFRFTLSGPTYAYAYGTVSCSALPIFDRILRRRVSVSMEGMFTSFTS